MNKIKTMLLVACVILTCGLFNVQVVASENVHKEEQISPMIIGPCSVHGVHRMHLVDNSGIVVKNRQTNETVMFNPLWYKCSCGEEVLCTEKPHSAGFSVGHYLTSGAFERRLSYSGVWKYLTDYTKGNLRYATSLWGYTFHSDY